MKNNQLNNKSISDYYTTASDDNDSMLAQYDDRASHSNTAKNSSSMFYKFLKISSKILNYIFYNIIPIGSSVFFITLVIASFYEKNITAAILTILALIVNILANFSNPPSNK